MIRTAADIRTPDITTLQHWKAMSDAAAAHKYFQDNPKAIEQTAKAIAGAYALTDDERRERDEAVKVHKSARQGIVDASDELKRIQQESEDAKADCKKSVQGIYADAKKAKEDADTYLAAKQSEGKKLDEAHQKRENDVKKRESAVEKAEEEAAAWRKAKATWEQEKSDWEDDYSARLTKLEARERKRIAG